MRLYKALEPKGQSLRHMHSGRVREMPVKG